MGVTFNWVVPALERASFVPLERWSNTGSRAPRGSAYSLPASGNLLGLRDRLTRQELINFAFYCSRVDQPRDVVLRSKAHAAQMEVQRFQEVALRLPRSLVDNSARIDAPAGPNDYWRWIREGAQTGLLRAIRLLNALEGDAARLFDWEGLDQLSQRMLGVRVSHHSGEEISRVLSRIPCAVTFDPLVKADVQLDDPTQLPYFRHYEYMHTALYTLCSLIAGYTVSTDQLRGRFLYRTLDELIEPSNVREVVAAIESTLSFASGDALEIEYVLPRIFDEASAYLIGYRLYKGASDFVWLHELSHILLGHLNKGAGTIEDEFQADRLALAVLISSYGDDPFPVLAGPAIVLRLLALLRVIGRSKRYGTHPDPEARAQRISKQLQALSIRSGFSPEWTEGRLIVPLIETQRTTVQRNTVNLRN